jgi:hypothetical protein
MISPVSLAAAALLATYNCSVEQPQALARGADGKIAAVAMQLPAHGPDDWKFSLRVTQDHDGYAAEISWPANPIDVNGRFSALPTAPGSFAFVAPARGPCLFTEQMCMSLVNLVATGRDDAAITIAPSALAQNMDKTRSPLVVVFTGVCVEGKRGQ